MSMLMDIVAETNRYATTADASGRLPGGEDWKEFTILELKAFLGGTFYMGMEKQPNVKSYWMKPPSIFHCSSISNIFTRKRYMTLIRCLHIMDPTKYVIDRALPGYDPNH